MSKPDKTAESKALTQSCNRRTIDLFAEIPAVNINLESDEESIHQSLDIAIDTYIDALIEMEDE